MRSGSGPRLFIRHRTHAEHKHQVCKSFRGRRGNRLDHLCHPAIKNDSGVSEIRSTPRLSLARADFVSVQHPVSAIEPSSTTSKTNGIVIFISENFGLTCGKRLHRENCAESFGI